MSKKVVDTASFDWQPVLTAPWGQQLLVMGDTRDPVYPKFIANAIKVNILPDSLWCDVYGEPLRGRVTNWVPLQVTL